MGDWAGFNGNVAVHSTPVTSGNYPFPLAPGRNLAGDGHCAAYRENLLESAARLLEIPGPIIGQAIEEELAQGHLIAEA